MKKTFTVICLIFTSCILQGQNVFALQCHYNQGNYVEGVESVMESDAGNYFFSAYDSDGSILTKTNSSGTVLWSRCYPYIGRNATCGDGILKAIQVLDTIYLGKIDEQGSMLWVKNFFFDPGFVLKSIHNAPNQNIVIAGEIRVNNIPQSVTVYVCDSMGVFLFGKNYSSASTIRLMSFDVASDNGFFLTGRTNPDEMILKTDQNGSILWHHTFTAGNGNAFQIHDAGEFSDGSILATGRYYSTGTNYSRPFILKHDASGVFQYLKYYLVQQEAAAVNHVYMQSNDDFWLVTDVNYTQYIRYRMYMRSDSSGTPVAPHLFQAGIAGNILQKTETLTSNNGFLEAWFTQLIDYPMFFMKTSLPNSICFNYTLGTVWFSPLVNFINVTDTINESMSSLVPNSSTWSPFINVPARNISYLCGNTGTVQVEVPVGEEHEFSISPNPASGIFNLKMSAKNISNASLAICDMAGRQIKKFDNIQLNSGNNEFTFDVSMLNSGVYSVQFVHDAGISQSNLVLIR